MIFHMFIDGRVYVSLEKEALDELAFKIMDLSNFKTNSYCIIPMHELLDEAYVI